MGRKVRRRRKRRKQQVQAPAARGVTLTNRGFLKSMTVTHREYIRDLVNILPGPNQISKVRIQPGDDVSFPWLSDIALRFESYVFTSLSLEYIPDVGTDTNGSIAICPDYDPADDNSSASRAKLFAFEDSVRGPLWNPMQCDCTRQNLRKRNTYFSARNGFKEGEGLYDTGNFWVSLNYEGDEPTIGELWVKYTIVLSTPQLEPEAVSRTEFRKEYLASEYDQPFKDLITTVNSPENGISVFNPNTIQFTNPGVYGILMHLAPALLSGAQRYFNDAWKNTPQLFQDNPADSALTISSHEVARKDSGVNDFADNEILIGYLTVDHNTTADRPLQFWWDGWSTDVNYPYSDAQVFISFVRTNEFVAISDCIRALPLADAPERPNPVRDH